MNTYLVLVWIHISGVYNLKQYHPYTIAPTIFILFFWSQKEPFNWPTINIIGTWANPQHKSQNTLMSLKYNHVLWCFPLALYTSLPMTFLFYNFYTLKLNHGQTIWDNKMKCYLEHLGNTLRIKKIPPTWHEQPLVPPWVSTFRTA